jgi:hypothetical protein
MTVWLQCKSAIGYPVKTAKVGWFETFATSKFARPLEPTHISIVAEWYITDPWIRYNVFSARQAGAEACVAFMVPYALPLT